MKTLEMKTNILFSWGYASHGDMLRMGLIASRLGLRFRRGLIVSGDKSLAGQKKNTNFLNWVGGWDE